MNRRIAAEIAVGIVAVTALFWWLYIRTIGVDFLPIDDPSIQQRLASNDDKVLVIGVDALDWDIAMPLINSGRMPNLSRLVRNGAHGRATSIEPMISPALWTTMATGKEREQHGITNFFEKVPFEYTESRVGSIHRKVPALWQIAAWAGRRVSVVNWFAAFPAEDLPGGVFAAEEIDPGKMTEHHVRPKEWFDRVDSPAIPKYQPYETALTKIDDDRVQRAYDLDRASFSVAFEILRETKPDLMMVYLRQTDVVSHGFYKYRWPLGLDYSYPVTLEERERYGNIIELHYEFVDRMIGGLLSEAEGYTVIIISDHGHGPTYPPKNIFIDLNSLLERIGALTYEQMSCDQLINELVRRNEISVPDYVSDNIFSLCNELKATGMDWAARGNQSVPAFAVEAAISRHYKFMPADNEDHEKIRSRMFADIGRVIMPDSSKRSILWKSDNDRSSIAWNGEDFHKKTRGIFINLADREPMGTVPRQDYDMVMSRLINSLSELRTENGDRLFLSVRKNPDKDVMPFGEIDPPDILVEINQDAIVQKHAYRYLSDPNPIPLDAVRWSYSDVSGDHELEGVIVISGPKSSRFKRIEASIRDLTPTVLWLMGVPVGSDMTGRVLLESFDQPHSEKEPQYIKSWDDIIEMEKVGLSPSLSPDQLKQFKDIGYVQ